MNLEQRLIVLSKRCSDTHTPEDIWEHMEEECHELLLAIKRVRRGREPMINVIEELIDVAIEVNTVITMLDNPKLIASMMKQKLDKFEAMLDKEKEANGYKGMTLTLVNRYKALPEIKGE